MVQSPSISTGNMVNEQRGAGRMTRIGYKVLGLLSAAVLLVGCTGRGPAPTPTPSPLTITPLHTEKLAFGFNVFLAGNSDGADLNKRTMNKVQEAGFGWVRVQMQWRELEPSPGTFNTAPYDTIIAAASSHSRVLVSVVKSPDWASPSRPGGLPEDPAAFGQTMRFLAEHYRGQVA